MTDNIPAEKNTESSDVNSPEMTSSGKVTQKSITSGEQAYGIASKLEQANRERNDLNSTILKKYNGGQPYDPKAMSDNLETWRSNAPTGFMSSIVDRITPAPLQAIDSAKYLSSATLYDGTADSDKKTEFFRQEVTRAIRQWDGWRDFLSSLCQENVLIGQAAPLNLDPYSPWPKMFKGDEVFLPDGAGQHAKGIPVLAAKEDLLVHEFTRFIRDYPDIDSGWEFDRCVKAINEALPKSTISGPNGESQARKWEDTIREGNVGASYSGAKVVELYHTLAVEPDSGKVTHYITNRRGEHEVLYSKEERFDCMEDIVTLFSLQPANGRYYASKGIGRMTLNLHIAIERARNGLIDNLNLSGYKIIKVPAGQTPNLQLKMVSPLMVVSSDGEFEQSGITVNVREYIEADDQVAKWAEQLVGSYITGLRGDEGGDRTATEATIDAKRDAQAKTAFLARFWGQLADLIGQITRRLCDPETTDEIAKKLQEALKDPNRGNLTDEEIKSLSRAPAAEVVADLTQMHNQQIVSAFEILKGDPNIDQKKLYERFLAAAVNPQFAQDVFLTEQGSQANDAEAMRQQMIETEAIMSGAPGMPVSPRDNHDIHLKTAFSDLKAGVPNIAKAAQADPSVLDHMNTSLVHTAAHINYMKAGNPNGDKSDEIKSFEQAQKMFEGLLQHIAETIRQQRMSQQASPQDAPPAPQDAPSAPPAPQAPPDQPMAALGGVLPLTEKIALAWIGQYDKLPDDEKRKLERVTGLGASTQDDQTVPPEPIRPMMPPVPSPMPPSAPAPARPAPVPPPQAPAESSDSIENIP